MSSFFAILSWKGRRRACYNPGVGGSMVPSRPKFFLQSEGDLNEAIPILSGSYDPQNYFVVFFSLAKSATLPTPTVAGWKWVCFAGGRNSTLAILRIR